MEEEQDPSTQYIKGFNTGYTMSKHEPELLNKLLKTDNEQSETLRALKAGKRQYELEKFKEQIRGANEQKKDKER